MLYLSLMLAGLGTAITTVALAIAISRDLWDRDQRARRLPSQRPTLRLWEPPQFQKRRETITLPMNLLATPGPDIIVGRKTAATASDAADRQSPRKAA